MPHGPYSRRQQWGRVRLGVFGQLRRYATRDFQREVRRAKMLYWRNLIDNNSDRNSVFKAVQWLRSPRQFQLRPLLDGVVYEKQYNTIQYNLLRPAACLGRKGTSH
jgi:hypothetical protein